MRLISIKANANANANANARERFSAPNERHLAPKITPDDTPFDVTESRFLSTRKCYVLATHSVII